MPKQQMRSDPPSWVEPISIGANEDLFAFTPAESMPMRERARERTLQLLQSTLCSHSSLQNADVQIQCTCDRPIPAGAERTLGYPRCRRSVAYSSSRSAVTFSDCGTVIPICFAAFMLITSSNLVDCSMGRSAGFAPLRIFATYVAASRPSCGMLGP